MVEMLRVKREVQGTPTDPFTKFVHRLAKGNKKLHKDRDGGSRPWRGGAMPLASLPGDATAYLT